MQKQVYISRPDALSILGNISSNTLRREIQENGFPQPIKVGKSQHFKTEAVYEWLSNKANRLVTIGDKLNSSKQLEGSFKRSGGWVWQHLQKNKAMKKKAIYIRSRPYWLESDIRNNKELARYLELVNQQEIQEVA